VAEDADARSLVGQRLSLRSRVKRSDVKAEILMGDTEEEVHPFSGQTMLRRLDVRKPEQMWLESTFESTESERVPSAYYIPAVLTAAIEHLRAHGIRLERPDQSKTVQSDDSRTHFTQHSSQTDER